jgi:hypothetical protein
MAGYFHRDTAAPVSLGGWMVDARWHSNSVAKFWSGILDEAQAGYPDAARRRRVASVCSRLPAFLSAHGEGFKATGA